MSLSLIMAITALSRTICGRILANTH